MRLDVRAVDGDAARQVATAVVARAVVRTILPVEVFSVIGSVARSKSFLRSLRR